MLAQCFLHLGFEMKKTLRRQAQHADGLNTTSRAFVLERKLVMLHTALPDLMTRRRASARALHAEHVLMRVSWSSDFCLFVCLFVENFHRAQAGCAMSHLRVRGCALPVGYLARRSDGALEPLSWAQFG